jgi:hypothetical protein
MVVVIVCCSLLTSISAECEASSDADAVWRGSYRFSYENVQLPHDERMGLFGASYLIDVTPYVYGGAAFYGAMTGIRGGFFTGGVAGGARLPLFSKTFADAGLYAGGGGGRGAPQGGGLMIRPHVGVMREVDEMRAGVQYSSVEYPNGNIRSRQIAVVLESRFDELRARGDFNGDPRAYLADIAGSADRDIVFTREAVGPRYCFYAPRRGSLNTGGSTPTEPFQTIGFGYEHVLSEHARFLVQAAGATVGNADGYSEVLAGVGVRIPLIQALSADAYAAAGAGGGGKVDTGNGMLAKAALGLSASLSPGMSFDSHGGVLESNGTFRANFLEASLSAFWEPAALGPKGRSRMIDDAIVVNRWRTHFTSQEYTSAFLRNRGPRRISLLGVKIDREFDASPFYAAGQALSAYEGDAGGYSAGFMGAGYESSYLYDSRFRIYCEGLVGAAGGGGIDTDGGAAVQANAGLQFDFGTSWGVEAGAGRIKVLRGRLDSTVLEFGATYRFGTFSRAI